MNPYDWFYRGPTPFRWDVEPKEEPKPDNVVPIPSPARFITDDRLREIVRQELAEIVRIDVPDAPPAA